jgi:WD40 repeat protein
VGTVADTLNNTGASLFEIGQVTSAGEAFARALRLDPAHERASFNLSLLRWRGAETSDEAVTRVLRERTENNARSETARGLEASVALERGDVSRFDELAGRGSLGIPAEDNALRDARRSLGEGNALVHTWPVPAERYGAVAVSPTGEQAFLAGKDVVDVFDLEAGDVVATLAGRRAGIDPNDGYAQYTHVLMAAHGALLCAVRADVRLSREGNSTRSRTEQTTLEVYDVRLRKRVWELPLGLGTAQGICLVDRTEARVAVALRDFSREKYAELTVIDLNARTARVVDVLAWPEVMSAFGAGIDAVAGMHDANAPLILVSYSIYFGILDVDRNEMIAHWRVDASLSDLQVSRDGRRAIGGGHCATEWDISSQVQRPLSGVQRYVNNHGVQAVRFFANEKRLIASDFADVVRIWDLERGRCLCTLATGAGGSVALDTFARGTRAVVVCEGARRTTSGRGDGAVQVYSLAPEEPSLLAASTIARPLEIDAVTSRVDRTDHLSGELDAAMNNGDLSKALRLLDLARRDEDLARSPKIQSIAVSLARLPSVRRGRFLEAWPVDTIHHELGHINVVAMSADGDTTAVGAMDDGRCAVFSDREGGKRLELSIGDGEVYGLALSADGAVLGGVTASGSVSCFELRARRRLFQFGYRDEVFSTAAIDSAGTIMIASDYSGGARVFDVRAGRERGALRGHERVVNAATVSQNGHIAGTVGQDKRLCIWRIDDLALIRVIELPEPSSSIAISDDATFVCCCDSAGTVRAFSIESGDLIGSFSDGDSSGLGLWLSPDSRLAITAAKGGMFCLWDVAERTLMKKLQTADRFVYEIIGSTDVH